MKKRSGASAKKEVWHLRLYVAGQSPKCVAALENIKKILDEHLKQRYTIELVDLIKIRDSLEGDQILAIPTPCPKAACAGSVKSLEIFPTQRENVSRP